jgi:RNA polymerase sigma factor (sigma-70 family)
MEKEEDDSDIYGVAPEKLIPEARDGDVEALRQLQVSDWLNQLLHTVSGRVSRRYSVDADQLWNYLFKRIELKIHTIRNPTNLPWPERLTRWAYSVCKNRAKNLIRQRKGAEERYRAGVEHDNTIKLTDGKRAARLHSREMSPYDRLARSEQDALMPAMRLAMRAAYLKLTPEDKSILSRWARKMTLQEISDETGTPLATVNYRIKRFMKPVVNELLKEAHEEERVAWFLANMKEYREGLRELLANSLTEAELRGEGTHARA